jgi:hypothetical protein
MKAMKLSLILTSVLTFAFVAQAADVTGKYKGTLSRSNGETLDIAMDLKQEGGKVTGKVSSANGELDIEEGKVDGDKLTYVVKFERDGNKVPVKNTAKIVGDTLEGKAEIPNEDGAVVSREWKVKKEASNAQFTGKWKSSFTRQDGNSIDINYNLKQEGDKLTGTTSFNNSPETEISEGKVNGKEVSFTIKRERDGRTFLSKYTGKLDGNKIVGKSESNFGGETRTRDWEATKQN